MFTEVLSLLAAHMGIKGAALVAFLGGLAVTCAGPVFARLDVALCRIPEVPNDEDVTLGTRRCSSG
jgi:hypothetical protein